MISPPPTSSSPLDSLPLQSDPIRSVPPMTSVALSMAAGCCRNAGNRDRFHRSDHRWNGKKTRHGGSVCLPPSSMASPTLCCQTTRNNHHTCRSSSDDPNLEVCPHQMSPPAGGLDTRAFPFSLISLLHPLFVLTLLFFCFLLTNSLFPSVCPKKKKKKNDVPQIIKIARENFIQEISFKSKDKDISLAKALLYVAAEDEAFMTFNRDKDACSFINERKDSPLPFEAQSESDSVEEISLAGKRISGWLNELDMIAKEVEAELVSRDIGCHMVEVLEAVNIVLFELRGFKRFPVLVDSKFSYLHNVLSSGFGSAIMLSIIYIEICRRLGVTMVGSCVGEEFLIWPQTGYPEELFKVSSGHSLFAIVNGRCVEDPRSRASDLNSKSLLGLDIATNRDIIGIALANLVRLHWKRASRLNHGLMLTSPLRPVYAGSDKASMVESCKVLLLRPQELRLAIMASERLLILQPHNWVLRRDHGMLLYYNRRYAEAVQELSICMAFAPVEEAEVLEPFVEKLHLLRLESSWKSLEHPGSVAVP